MIEHGGVDRAGGSGVSATAPIRVYILGNPDPSSWKWDVEDGCKRIGWDVVGHVRPKYFTVDMIKRDIIRYQPDLLIWARTHRDEPRGDVWGFVHWLKELSMPTVGIHLDLYWDIEKREPAIGKAPWWKLDYHYTADGGDRYWESRGINHRWLPPPAGARWFKSCTRPLPDWFNQGVSRETAETVYFFGTASTQVHRNHRLRLLEWAKRRWGKGFRWVGARHLKLRGHQLCRVYPHARALLGDSAPADRYWSDRVPLTLVRGGILAHPRTVGFAEQGFTDETMLLFDHYDFDTLGDRIDSLTERERKDLTEAGKALIWDRHLWTHRLKEIADEVL